MTSPAATVQISKKVESFGSRTTDMLEHMGHVPSLALYRVQEHIRKSIPVLVEKMQMLQRDVTMKADDRTYAVDFARDAIPSFEPAIQRFQDIKRLLLEVARVGESTSQPGPLAAASPEETLMGDILTMVGSTTDLQTVTPAPAEQ